MRRILAALVTVALILLGAPPAAAEPIFVGVRAHVQEVGWQPYVADSQTAGTTGRSLRLEAIQLRGGVGSVSAHVQDIGWMPAVPNGTTAGTTGRSLRMEAIRVRSDVRGWAIECRAHVQDVGWTGWVGDGQTCGTTGRSKRLEAVQLRLTATGSQTPAEPTGADSNRAVDQTAMLIGYKSLPASTIAASDALTVTINHGASADRQRLAVRDADHTRLSSVTVAMGPRLSGYLAELTAAGKLPKFRALLAQGAAAMQTPDASSSATKTYFGVTRPIDWPSTPIRRVPKPGSAYSDVAGSLSFPSGHARIGMVEAAALAVMLPEVAPQILDRGADFGHSRIVLGVHTPLDVIGGKAVALRMVAQRLDDRQWRTTVFEPAMREVRTALEAKCGTTIAACADAPGADGTYRQRLTYGLPQSGTPGVPLAVPTGAEALLTYSHPTLTAEQRRQILASTAIDSGYPLDMGRTAADSGWTRIDLATALGYAVSAAEAEAIWESA